MVVGILCGATATGKSALALELARANGFEIISADSRQIYRGFEAGTNAPSAADQVLVKHHFTGFLDPSQTFSPREYPIHVHRLLDAHPDARYLIVGGTGLYLKELLYPSPFDRGPTPDAVKEQVQDMLRTQGLARLHAALRERDPEAAEATHPNDAYRIVKRWENLLITGESYTKLTGPPMLDARFAGVPILWLDRDREELYKRIDARVEEMVAAGWLKEVKRLMTPGWEHFPAFSSLGYREMAAVAQGQKTLMQAVAEIQKSTRNYAKRQVTFFRHQFPTAQRWEVDRLRAALIQCGWDWNLFRMRFPDGKIAESPGNSGASDGSNP